MCWVSIFSRIYSFDLKSDGKKSPKLRKDKNEVKGRGKVRVHIAEGVMEIVW